MKSLLPTQVHTLHRLVQINLRQFVLVTLVLGLVFSALLAIPFVFYYRAESDHTRSLLQAEQDHVVKLAAVAIHQEIDSVLSDLRYFSQHNEIKHYMATASTDSRMGLAGEYLGLVRQKSIYDQVRFIGLNGREEVRVDFNNGKPEIVADAALQNKRGRYYFEETQWLAPGQIYVSPFDLNIERNAIERPFKPVIRFAMPVADANGQIRGMVVLNYLGQRLIDKLRGLEEHGGKIRLINSDGYWLIGPKAEDEWGFMFPERSQQLLSRLAPALWQQMETEKTGRYHTATASVRFERVYPLTHIDEPPDSLGSAWPVAADSYYWQLVAELSPAAIDASNNALLNRLSTIYGTLVMFAFLVAGALAFVIHRNKALGESLEKVIDSLPVMVAFVDLEQRYRFNNKVYEKFFRLSPRQLYGMTMHDLLGDTAYQEIRPHVEEALAGKRVFFERQSRFSGLEMRDLVVTFLPDISPQGDVRGFFVVANDITQVKQAERQERRRLLELAHVSRLASMGEMATEIAHEINQPLAAIAMYSAAGLRTLQNQADPAQLNTWLENINAQAKRASDIVRRVRHFVQKSDHRQGPVNLNHLAGEAADLLRHEARTLNIEIVLQLAEDLPPVQGEVVLLEQVVFNLLRNAMDSLPPEADSRRITLVTSFDTERIYVDVRDTGVGVDAALGERVFDSFMTTKPDGAGMGLAISRSIIETHAGQLGYVLNPEGGSTFTFSLPRGTS